MNLPVFSTLVSFLDINDFQDCSGQIELFSALSDPVKLSVLVFWLKHTYFSVDTEISYTKNYPITIYRRNRMVHKSNDKPAFIKNKRNEWFLCGKRHRKQGRPEIVLEDGLKVWLQNGNSVRMNY